VTARAEGGTEEATATNGTDDGLLDVAVIGGSQAGLAMAWHLARARLRFVVLEAAPEIGHTWRSRWDSLTLFTPTQYNALPGMPFPGPPDTYPTKDPVAGYLQAYAAAFNLPVRLDARATHLGKTAEGFEIRTQDEAFRARQVVVATGPFQVPFIPPAAQRLDGSVTQVHSAGYRNPQALPSGPVLVVGGGNSAGQAAVFLSQGCSNVNVLVRGTGLADSMSRYLIQRIDDSANVTLRARTEIVALEGEHELERVRWRQLDSGAVETRPIRHVFLMTGADPNTAWLKGCVALDDTSFVKTGADLLPAELEAAGWPLARRPELLETSTPGVFAVGDVRSGSIKRVASAVGEGSVCVQLIHRALREV